MSTSSTNGDCSEACVTTETVEIHSGEKVPILSGRYLDLDKVAKHDDDPYADDKRQKAILRALEACGLRDRPCMAVDIAPVRELGLTVNDGVDVKDPHEGESRPPCARVIVPARHIVDISSIRPPAGRSVIRCNGAFPTYRWFQAINLLLHHENKTAGRVIPFPLETNAEANHGSSVDPSSILYHALRVTKAEFEAYQRLLADAVENDGVENGFFHAGKFAYEVLFNRGHKEINEKTVGEYVTNIMMMGKPLIRGVVVSNWSSEDFTKDFADSHFIFG